MIFNGTRSKRRGLGGKEAWAEEEALTSLRYCYFSVLRGASECTKNRSGGSLLARIVIGDDNPPWLAGCRPNVCHYYCCYFPRSSSAPLTTSEEGLRALLCHAKRVLHVNGININMSRKYDP